MDYKVKDLSLAEQGKKQIEWAEIHMPALMEIRKQFEKEKPLQGLRISAVLHVTKETAVLVKTLKIGGATVALAGSNPLSTQDDVAAALVEEGIRVFAWRGETEKDYYDNIKEILKYEPQIIMDDGGDLHAYVHENMPQLKLFGGTEETTTGVIRLKAMEEQGVLRYPVIAVNNAFTKYLFDNRIGTGQSTIDGILRATNILIAGKVAVVAGYGWVGRGIAQRLRGMGARVIVVEVSPLRALEAVMDGFDVMPMSKAAELGEIFITATGNINVIRKEHILKMKDGAILANSGHFNVEIDVKGLKEMAKSSRLIRPNLEEYELPNGKRIYLLAEGRLVNLAAAEGHPSEVMDLSFSNQALSVKYIYENRGKLENKVYNVPQEIDETVAKLKLNGMGIEIEPMTQEQIEYMKQWRYGT
ncbi:adenosylhomocysteinase [Sulfurisphaera tokodaii]|uniref:Adenosylhomocysteinase n=2 Tax=Sulfurisphaera tokodaii TaxID=111955 RepID=SAHH_SULTO|nr:adenosylhomocysteinase [Sulfurisphaera tokodaii]Q975T0.1 RecName: Full=Adenosylhomocysteinase; AltName: Full=S-adenosyl-L-homocysteine hydrolase; Short=AdoHcyase [Sulfurisphaera tokodaii str. 7]BAK54243.1 adenosylhomocysteinase [Sulfurisphaera tokodaii str. 7]HII74982.1 adenosylhomocysteinase [Sulfurisphaera tokodaii]